MDYEPTSGRLTATGHEFPVRVYYEDTDFTGIVYHARYLQFFERGRTEWLRMLGVHHHQLINGKYGESLAFTIRSINVQYMKPARIDDALLVETSLKKMGASRFVLSQTLMRGADIVSMADVDVVVINSDGKPRRVPKDLVERLAG